MNKLLLFLLTTLFCTNIFGQNTLPKVTTVLNTVATDYNLNTNDISEYEITHQHVSNTSGIHHIYIRQQYQGIPVFNAIGNVHFDRDGELFREDMQFVSSIASKIESSSDGLTPIQALQSVVNEEGYTTFTTPNVINQENNVIKKTLLSESGISQEPIPMQLLYQKTESGNLRLAWDLSILELDGQNWWSIRVDANTGEILDKTNWMISCNHESTNETDECGNAIHKHNHKCVGLERHEHAPSIARAPDSYRVYPLGIESPNHGARTLEVNPANAVASPFGWHDTNGAAGAEFTNTRGNNVHAQEDTNGNNGTGSSPSNATLDFDYPINFAQAPTTTNNQNAAITNLFYWNNIMHDVWYQYGFDEASGNFQENNYGNGGSGSDFVFADAQDGAGTNNANFGTPNDGSNPRMQMFLWTGGNSPLEVNSPPSVAGAYTMVVGGFGPSTFNVTGDLVIVDDGTAAPTEACSPIINGGALSGNIALIDRANCEFGSKILNAQNNGAIAAIVCQHLADAPFSMGPGDDGGSVNIPSVMISRADCNLIRAQIPTVNVTLEVSNNLIDGDFDSGIIAHEYGHGISTRLTGGANNTSCLFNDEQMGEGWSDWFGLMLTTDASDVGTARRGIGTFALSEPTNGTGIRTYPYSTNFSISPYTYNDIRTFSVPHGVGSVWCSMLWEMTWELVGVYGWDNDYYNGTGGNNIAMALVTEGLKLQPCNPGFVDGRDAILAADLALYNGANQCLIWTAFARRGLGVSATQGSSNSRSDGNEAFDTDCDAPTCNDGIQNGSETGIDCGGSCVPCCDADVVINNNVATGTYQTSNSITSDGTVGFGANVNFFSNCIQLDPGFTVTTNSNFTALINPCTPFAPTDPTIIALQEGTTAITGLTQQADFMELDYQVETTSKVSIVIIKEDQSFAKVILNKSVEEGKYQQQIDYSDLSAGIYQIILKTDDKEVMESFEITKN